VCEEDDTSEIVVATLSILTHVATYIWGSDSFGGFLLLSGCAYIETLARWARTVYPFDFPPMMVDRWTFYFILFGWAIGAWNNTVESKIPLVDPS
jgi:hypothetical protein